MRNDDENQLLHDMIRAQQNKKRGKASADFRMSLKCFSCGRIFNLGEAGIDHEKLPNTFSGNLPDHNAPKLSCPRCGVWETPDEKFEDFEANDKVLPSSE